jgi:hypothetical protein
MVLAKFTKKYAVTMSEMGAVAYSRAHKPCAETMKPNGTMPMTIGTVKKFWKERYNVHIVSPNRRAGRYMNSEYKFVFENEGAYMLFLLEWA